jgi:hypothetical protein
MVERLVEQNLLAKGIDTFTPATIESNMPSRYVRETTEKRSEPKQTAPQSQNVQFHQVAAALGLSKVVINHGRSD